MNNFKKILAFPFMVIISLMMLLFQIIYLPMFIIAFPFCLAFSLWHEEPINEIFKDYLEMTFFLIYEIRDIWKK